MWWIEILEKYWKQMRDFIKNYGVLSFVILAVYFILISVIYFIIRWIRPMRQIDAGTYIEYGMYLPQLFWR